MFLGDWVLFFVDFVFASWLCVSSLISSVALLVVFLFLSSLISLLSTLLPVFPIPCWCHYFIIFACLLLYYFAVVSPLSSLLHYVQCKNFTYGIIMHSSSLTSPHKDIGMGSSSSRMAVVLLASSLSFNPCFMDVLATWYAYHHAKLALAPRVNFVIGLDHDVEICEATRMLHWYGTKMSHHRRSWRQQMFLLLLPYIASCHYT